VLPEILSQPALDAVTTNRIADLAADADSQAIPGGTGSGYH
jgi:hypothetical protein